MTSQDHPGGCCLNPQWGALGAVSQLQPRSVILITVLVFDPFQPQKTMTKQDLLVSMNSTERSPSFCLPNPISVAGALSAVLLPGCFHLSCRICVWIRSGRGDGCSLRALLSRGNNSENLPLYMSVAAAGPGGCCVDCLSLSRKTSSRAEWKTSLIHGFFLGYLVARSVSGNSQGSAPSPF